MKKKSIGPSFNENKCHVWIKYNGKWHRFTDNAIEAAQQMAESNKHETPKFIDRVKYFLRNIF